MNDPVRFDPLAYTACFLRNGYFISNGVLSGRDVQRQRDAVAALPNREEVRRRRSVYGVRNLLHNGTTR